jgi:membrane protein
LKPLIKPHGRVLAPDTILGLLIFRFTVVRFLLYLTAWAATARENELERPPLPPPPAVIRSEICVHRGPGAGASVGLIGAGAVAGLLGGQLLGRHRAGRGDGPISGGCPGRRR